MLDVRRLRVLREISRAGSFSAAAESLSYTQSGVSQHVAALEREVGTPLVVRQGRRIWLTEAGEALVRHADRILGAMAEAEAEVDRIAGLRAGSVRVGTFLSAGVALLPPAIGTFKERHPGIEVEVTVTEPDDATGAVLAGSLDVGVIVQSTMELPGDGAERVHLLDDPLYLALPADHPLAARRRLKLADLSDASWIAGSPQLCPDSDILVRACQEAGFEPQIAFRSDDYNAVQGFIAAGVGVALIPDLALVSVREDLAIRAIVDAPARHIFSVALAGGHRTPATAAMLETLAETAAEHLRGRRDLPVAA